MQIAKRVLKDKSLVLYGATERNGHKAIGKDLGQLLKTKKLKIKVRKVNVVEKIDENNYSKPFLAWFYDKTNVVYDYELNFPIGKIGKDEQNNLNQLDKNTYIIDKTISMPEFKLFD